MMPRLSLLLLLLLTAQAEANGLGRLFYTPAERQQLDRQYVPETGPLTDNSRTLIVNGVVQREGGKRTIWVNGKQQPAGTADSRTPASVPVAIPGRPNPVRVKVGERLDLDQAESAAK